MASPRRSASPGPAAPPLPPPSRSAQPPNARLPRLLAVLLGIAALVIALAGLETVSGIVGPAFLALVLTITVHPVRVWLDRKGLPDLVSSIIALVLVYAILVGLAFALVISVAKLADLLPTYVPEINSTIADIGETLRDFGVDQAQIDAVLSSFDVGSLVGVATGLLSSLLGVLGDLFFIITVLLFIVFDTTKLGQVLTHVNEERPYLVEGMLSFARGTRSYMAVSAGFGLIVAIIDWGALLILGIPGAFVWGVLAFVTNFIPNIGFVLGVIPPAIIGLLEGGPGLALAVIAVYSVINVVIQTVIQPRIVGDAVGLSATITFLSLVFWAWLLGALGALLAVPLTLLMRALLVEADPEARWVLPLLSGKPPEAEEARLTKAAGRKVRIRARRT